MKEIALNKLPKEVYEVVDEYNKKFEEADNKVERATFFTNKVYSIYTLIYPYAYAGRSNSETLFTKNGEVIASDIVNLGYQLESVDGNNLFLSTVAASGGTNYAITDMKSEQMWREEFRDFGLISPKRTGKIFITTSKKNVINVRESYGSDSSIIHTLANNVEVEEISNKEGWKYVYFYNKDGGYYMKGYIHKSQLELHPETYVVFSKDGYANLRRGTTINSEILDVLDNGEYVTKLDEVGEWYRVEYAAFDGGYIHKSQLKKYTK